MNVYISAHVHDHRRRVQRRIPRSSWFKAIKNGQGQAPHFNPLLLSFLPLRSPWYGNFPFELFSRLFTALFTLSPSPAVHADCFTELFPAW